MNTTRRTWLALLVLAGLGIPGCATVHPWDRDLMAKKSMRFVPLPHEMAVDDHIYFSKEGTSGGRGFGGGGCGCN